MLHVFLFQYFTIVFILLFHTVAFYSCSVVLLRTSERKQPCSWLDQPSFIRSQLPSLCEGLNACGRPSSTPVLKP